MKKKLVFIGDTDSINLEIIFESQRFIQNKIKYILIGNINDLYKYKKKKSFDIEINELLDPFNFKNYKKSSLNIFNVEDISKQKYINLLNQIDIANYLANSLKIDLVTLPINKSIFKSKINFNGMTEHLATLNNKKTKMLMYGERFSVIPITTHINLKEVHNFIKKKYLKKNLNEVLNEIKRDIYNLNFKSIKFLCYNPHCSENETIGLEDKIIKESLSSFKKINGPYSADSAFNNLKEKTLFISMYHDQALIPFKILNKKGINMTIGLNYRRLSPAHGTAKDIKYKNKADTSSYLTCMKL